MTGRLAVDEAELARVRRIVHALVCRDGLTAQLASSRLTAYAIERSPAEIGQDLQLASCEVCARQAAQPAPQAEPDEPVRAVHHQGLGGGWLTGMIGRG